MKLDVSALNDMAMAMSVPFATVVEVVEKGIGDAYAKSRGADPEARVDLDTKRGQITVRAADGTDITPTGFDRLAATTMRQAVQMWMRDRERRAKLGVWADRAGTLVSGKVRAHAARNARGETLIDIGGGIEAVMPSGEAIEGETLAHNQEVTAYVVAVNPDERDRLKVTVSRRQPALVSALIAANSPEVRSGAVEIVGVAREPRVRTKVGVAGDNALEAVFGGGAYRIRAVAEKVGTGEKIDVVVHPGTIEGFVANALTPAKGVEVTEDPEIPGGFIAHVPEDQLHLAIGKGGRNTALAKKLTGARSINVVAR